MGDGQSAGKKGVKVQRSGGKNDDFKRKLNEGGHQTEREKGGEKKEG